MAALSTDPPSTPCRRAAGSKRLVLMISFLLMIASTGLMHAQPEAAPEYQIKAVFLFNFAKFVEWPPESFPEPDTPLIIGVLGNDPFGAYLDATVRGEAVNGHPLLVRRFRNVSEVQQCHIVFVNNAPGELKVTLKELGSKSTLTVGEMNGFVRGGGMISFLSEDNKTRIRINLKAAREANLNISSKLLRLAEVVDNPQ